MKKKNSRKARLLAMLLCTLMVIQSFSGLFSLSFSLPVAAADDNPIVLHFDIEEVNGKSVRKFYTDYENKIEYTGSNVLVTLLNNLHSAGHTSITIYMHDCYSTTGPGTVNGHGITTLIRASDYSARYNASNKLIADSGGPLFKMTGTGNTITLKNIIIDGGAGEGLYNGTSTEPELKATKAAVFVEAGEMILDSGTEIRRNYNISEPTNYGGSNGAVDQNGGGVFVYANTTVDEDGTPVREFASLTIESGVKIYQNTCAGKRRGFGGGGIFTLGPVVMNGGEIFENKASNFVLKEGDKDRYLSGGGGVMVFSKEGEYENGVEKVDGYEYTPASFTMNAGAIYNNSAELGGGIFSVGEYIEGMNDSFVRIREGTEIYNNTATRAGAGVYMGEGSKLIMDGGKIHNNTCSKEYVEGTTIEPIEYGGGLFFNGILLEFNGGSIYDNTSAKRGDFYYYTDSDQTDLNKNAIKYTMFGKEVGWMRKNQNPMQSLTQVSIDLTDQSIGLATGFTHPIKVTKIKTSLNTYTGQEELVDFYTTSQGNLYLWLEPGEFVESITITDGTTSYTVTEPQDRRPRANIHYDYIGEGRVLVAQLENPPAYINVSDLTYNWQYKNDAKESTDWINFRDNNGHQTITLNSTAVTKYSVRVRISYHYQDANGVEHTLEWESRAVRIKDKITYDATTGTPYEEEQMPTVNVAKYVRPGTVIESFITGYDDLLEADGQAIPSNGSFTVHFDFDHFHFSNLRLFIYVETTDPEKNPGNVYAGEFLPVGTRLILTDVCCCGDDSVIGQYSHDAYGDVYCYTIKNQIRIIDVGASFKRMGDPNTSLSNLSDMDSECKGHSRYQLTVILPEDCVEEFTINVAIGNAEFHNNGTAQRISNSTTRVQTKRIPGDAELTATNPIVAAQTSEDINYYANSSGVTLNVNTTGVTATATVIEADKPFPYGTTVSYRNARAIINGKYAIFHSLLDNETVTITGLDEQVYTLKVHTSRADDWLNPMKTIDLLGTSATVKVQTTIDRLKPTLVPDSGMTEKDMRFIPYGTERTLSFTVNTTGAGKNTSGLLMAAVYMKDADGNYVEVDTSLGGATIQVNTNSATAPKTADITSNSATPIGTYRIVFTWGTAKFNYNFIVHS